LADPKCGAKWWEYVTEDNRESALADMRIPYTDEEINSIMENHSMNNFVKNIRYELPSDDTYLNGDERLIEADGIKLNNITDHPGWKLTFEYDYGDGWEVTLILEQCEKREVSLTGLPCVLEGEGFGIIEDVGGVTGLGNLAKALKRAKAKNITISVHGLVQLRLTLLLLT